MLNTPTDRIKNEVNRTVIQLPANTCFYRDKLYLALAFDADESDPPIEVLGSQRLIPYLADYEIIDMLCRDRAQRTVDETLRVDDKPITPERYLHLWRLAIEEPLDLHSFENRYGFAVQIEMEGPLSLRGTQSNWSEAPYRSFDDFESAHHQRLHYDMAEQRFRCQFNLADDDEPRSALYLASLMQQAAVCECRSQIRFLPRKTRRPGASAVAAQGQLF